DSGLHIHLLRYEDLLAATVATFARVADFLGLEKPLAVIERAVEATRFDTLRGQEQTSGFRERQPRQEIFFRRGIAGGWCDELTAEQVARIEKAHGPSMGRPGS